MVVALVQVRSQNPRCVFWRVWVLYNIIGVWEWGATARVVAVVIRMRIRWLTVWQMGTGGTLSAVSILEVLLQPLGKKIDPRFANTATSVQSTQELARLQVAPSRKMPHPRGFHRPVILLAVSGG